jgi:hypothetical protein
MAFDFDTGPQGSAGPWVAWSARGTQDGAIPAKTFYLSTRNEDKTYSKTPLTCFDAGVVLDIENMKTGWEKNDGVIGQAPEWKLGASPSKLPEKPGDDWKKGFQIRCAISTDQAADWNQSGAGAWGAFVELAPGLSNGPTGQLPVVRVKDVKHVQFTKGSTMQPIFEIVKWVDRPAVLSDVSGGIDTGGDAETPAGEF